MNRLLFGVLLLLLSPHVFAVPAIQQWTTNKGALVSFTQATEIPIVDVRVVFDAGAARDDGKAGLAALTNSLLSEGAGQLNADQIAERLDDVGAQLGSSSHRDMAVLSVRSLSDEKVLREAIGLTSLILSSPTFPERSFERKRKSMLVGLRASLQNPASIAEKAFMKAIYGSHPYASPPDGTVESLNAMSVDDVRQYYKKYYVASNAVIAIVGDISRNKAEALAEVLTGSLPAGEKAPALPGVEMIEGKMVRINHPSTQAHIWVGQPGMTRTDADYYALYVGNHTLGGSGLVSLLSDEVREKRGLAYSAYSYFSPMRMAGPFQMTLQTKSDYAVKALDVMRETTKNYLEGGITQEQLTASRQNITGGFALRLDSNKKLAEYLAMIGFYGLPLDYLNNFNSRIEAVTVEDVNDAFRRRVTPDKMVTIIVGPDTLPVAANSDNQEVTN
ncbi:MAG: insulinase family protein [Gammaproteobacteria bacterium]|nr:insulinase family protein [Gammaproteobacteria bacterium]